LPESIGAGLVETTSRRPVPWPTDERFFVDGLNAGLTRLLGDRPDAFLMGEDLLDPYGGAFKVARGLSSRFPDRVISTPISEGGIVAWATGAALRGMRPVVEIMFGDFLTLAADQIVNHASKYRWIYGGDTAIPLVVRATSGAGRGYGPTHSQSLETMFLDVPGLFVVAPSHLLDPGELLVRATVELRDPTLFVEHKLLYGRPLAAQRDGRVGDFYVRASERLFPTVHLSLTEFERPDVCLVCYGGTVPAALDAATDLLMRHETVCDVIVPAQVSPVPVDDLLEALGSCRRVVVVEEGVAAAGWSATVIAAVAERDNSQSRRYARIGPPSSPVPASRALEAPLLPSADLIVRRVLEEVV
jgi:pyruvate/2-oxoglutarate/acetoin dehydrogenase E1 component